jgi:hypothetical protein
MNIADLRKHKIFPKVLHHREFLRDIG